MPLQPSTKKTGTTVLANAAAATTTQILLTVAIDWKTFQQEHITPEIMQNIANSLLRLLLNYARTEPTKTPVNVPIELTIMFKQMVGLHLTDEEQAYDTTEHEIDFCAEVLNGISYSSSWLLGQSFLNSLRNAISNKLYTHIPAVTAYFAAIFWAPTLLQRAIDHVLQKTHFTTTQKELLRPWCEAIGNLLLNLKPRVHITADGKANYQFANLKGHILSYSANNTATLKGDNLVAVDNADGATLHVRLSGTDRVTDFANFRVNVVTNETTGILEISGISNITAAEPQRLLADRAYNTDAKGAVPTFIESTKQVALNSLPLALMVVPGGATLKIATGLLLMSNFALATPAPQAKTDNGAFTLSEAKEAEEFQRLLNESHDAKKNLAKNGKSESHYNPKAALTAVQATPTGQNVKNNPEFALLEAMRLGLTDVEQQILANKWVDLNTWMSFPTKKITFTALTFALSKNRSTSFIEQLLEAGADPNYFLYGDHHPLEWTIANNDEQAAALLIHYGADPNSVASNGQTVFQNFLSAYQPGQFNLNMLQILLNGKANPNTFIALGKLNTPTLSLIISINTSDDAAIMVINAGADINLKSNPLEKTPLMFAAFTCRINVVKALLTKKEVCVSCTDNDGKTAEDLAREAGNTEIAELLHSHATNGKSVTANDNRTPPWFFRPIFKVYRSIFKSLGIDPKDPNPLVDWGLIFKVIGFFSAFMSIEYGYKTYKSYKLSQAINRARINECLRLLTQLLRVFSIREPFVQQNRKLQYSLQLAENGPLNLCFTPHQGISNISVDVNIVLKRLANKFMRLGIMDQATVTNTQLSISFKAAITGAQIQALPELLTVIKEEIITELVANSPELAAFQRHNQEQQERQAKTARFDDIRTKYDLCLEILRHAEVNVQKLTASRTSLATKIHGIEIHLADAVEPTLPDLTTLPYTREHAELRNAIDNAYHQASDSLTFLRNLLPRAQQTLENTTQSIPEAKNLVTTLVERNNTCTIYQEFNAHTLNEDTQLPEQDLLAFNELQTFYTKQHNAISRSDGILKSLNEKFAALDDALQEYDQAMNSFKAAEKEVTRRIDAIEEAVRVAAAAQQAAKEQVQREKAEHANKLRAMQEEKRRTAKNSQNGATTAKNHGGAAAGSATPAAAAETSTTGSARPSQTEFTIPELVNFFRPNLAEINRACPNYSNRSKHKEFVMKLIEEKC
jgi:ankyrin repeat protein/exonuclease VII small subunit